MAFPAVSHAQQSLPLPYRKGDQWGFADENRRLVIPALYDQVSFFRDSTYELGRLLTHYAEAKRGDTTG